MYNINIPEKASDQISWMTVPHWFCSYHDIPPTGHCSLIPSFPNPFETMSG